jgi:predicted GH43/DUF377 family glycosyl hydrolase
MSHQQISRRNLLKLTADTNAGWMKYSENPVIGGSLGTCFDLTALNDDQGIHMWFSWRPRKSIAYVHSKDGIHWSEPQIELGPNPATKWENDINRPSVVKTAAAYHLWYTGQVHGEGRNGQSWIGHAISPDGHSWTRTSDQPVLSPEQPWEKVAVMCPHVLWDEGENLFKMWYSGGEQYEPNAIGYATSKDGRTWLKHPSNPIFVPDPNANWEQHKVTACQVIRQGDWYVMFYIGFGDEDHAQIGIARSRDGMHDWERHPGNPVIGPGDDEAWDSEATYKPFALFDAGRWLLWYNGRRGSVEQIGLAIHEGEDLGFGDVRNS